MPIPQGQGRPLTDHQIQEIASLLKDTDGSVTDIAKSLECTRISVCKINKKYNLRTKNEGEGGRQGRRQAV